MVICLERGADLHMAHRMPLPLTVSCFSKIQIGFTFLVPAHPGSPGKGPLNGCVCIYTFFSGTRLQVRPVDGFSLLMAQMMQTRTVVCHLGSHWYCSPFGGEIPQNPNFGAYSLRLMNRRFRAKRAKY